MSCRYGGGRRGDPVNEADDALDHTSLRRRALSAPLNLRKELASALSDAFVHGNEVRVQTGPQGHNDMTQRPSNRSDPEDLNTRQRDEQELVRLALETIAGEIRRKPPQLGAPRALAMIREPAFQTKVAKAVEEVQRWKSTTKPEEWGYSMRYGVLTAQHREWRSRLLKVTPQSACSAGSLGVILRPVTVQIFRCAALSLRNGSGISKKLPTLRSGPEVATTGASAQRCLRRLRC